MEITVQEHLILLHLTDCALLFVVVVLQIKGLGQPRVKQVYWCHFPNRLR